MTSVGLAAGEEVAGASAAGLGGVGGPDAVAEGGGSHPIERDDRSGKTSG